MLTGESQPSAWVDYADDRYKFISVAIFVSADKEFTVRETYEFLTFLGDVGGLYEFCRVLGASLAIYFNKNRVAAIVSNRLYHLSMHSKGAEK